MQVQQCSVSPEKQKVASQIEVKYCHASVRQKEKEPTSACMHQQMLKAIE